MTTTATRVHFSSLALCLSLAFILCATSAQAGPLDGDPAAMPAWTGSTTFNNGLGLAGYVDFAVYLPGDFPVGFLGYVPTPGEVVYTYQVYETDTLPVTAFTASIAPGRPRDNIGSFTGSNFNGAVSGDTPTSASFTGSGAQWLFSGIPQGGSSIGLAYSSPNLPENRFGSVIDGGTGAIAIPLPAPSATPFPEPASSVLALLGLGALGICGWRRRMRTA